MDHGWVIDLLPSRGLDQSILIAVLLGMWVLLAFTEFFGWVFIGVVVPGYLASVLVISPTTAFAIIVEALISLFFSRLLAQTLNKTGAWTHFFGRDRFFLIVLVSVFIRQFDQTWLIPELTLFLRDHGWPDLDLQTDFSSIGLVLVPLAANMFWKLNVFRGFVQISTVVGLTYAGLRWGLLPLTNLSYSSFELTYEDSAINFIANGKSYIIMLSTAYVAGVVNLRYGWDFGGILVAALLALLWPTPTKLALTLIESIILLGTMKAFVRLPVIRNLNLEGPRKVCTVFTLAFLLKWAIGFSIGNHFPGLKITDLFAFGYLMSSLLAVRMLVRKSIRVVLLPALTTSVLGFMLGSGLGFVAQQLIADPETTKPATESSVSSRRLLRSPDGVAAYASARFSVEPIRPYTDEVLLKNDRNLAWVELASWLFKNNANPSDSLLRALSKGRVAWVALERSFDHAKRSHLFFAGEREDGTSYRGPLVVANAGADGPLLVVENPRGKLGLAEYAVSMCTLLRCQVLVFLDQAPKAAPDNPLADEASAELLRAFSPTHSIWVLLTDASIPVDAPRIHPVSAVEQAHPAELASFALDWSLPKACAAWVQIGVDRIVRVHPDTISRQIGQHIESSAFAVSTQSAANFLHEVVAETKPEQHIAFSIGPTAQFPPAFSATELRLAGQHIVAPLLQELGQSGFRRPILDRLARRAALLNLDMTYLPNCEGQDECIALTSVDLHHGVALMVRRESQFSLDFEIPRPYAERGTFGLGLAAWSALRARAIALDLGPENRDPTRSGTVHNLFQAIHQELDRFHSGGRTQEREAIVQIRGFSDAQAPNMPAILGVGTPLTDRRQVPQSLHALVGAGSPLPDLSGIRLSDGSADVLRFAASTVPQVAYNRWLGEKELFTLWYSAELRERYRFGSFAPWPQIEALHRAPSRVTQTIPTGLFPATPSPEISAGPNDRTHRPNFDHLSTWVDEFAFLGEVRAETTAQATPGASFAQALNAGQQLARYGHPQAVATLSQWSRSDPKNARGFGLAHGWWTGLDWLWIEERSKDSCTRALILLGEAREDFEWVNFASTSIQGPVLHSRQAIFGRTRILLASCGSAAL